MPKLTIAELRSKIAALPRYALARLPTPLDAMPRMSDALGIDLHVKREDMTGLAFGGNKTRELDFFIGEAKARGATVFVAGGGVAQSNHAVQCSAAALRAGLKPVMVLHRFRADDVQGNLLLLKLMSVDVRFVESASVDSAIDARNALQDEMRKVAQEYERKGDVAWVLPSSFHVLGAIGYVDAAAELSEQLAARSLDIDHVYLCSGGATQAGLILGLKALGSKAKVTGISYTASTTSLPARMAELGAQASKRLGLASAFSAEDVHNESYAGPGYGIPTEEGRRAIAMAAALEGMFLDPVYSGKGMAGLIDHVRKGLVRKGERVVFVHTGGLPGIFAYSAELISPMD
jgi:D-cysteine desulfhydrase family pyridoxal phosphate-dependent enzyme